MARSLAKAEVERAAEPTARPWLSPLNQRRWQNFKANRRGYWSLWIFLVLFVLSLFAEFIANDRPILASYKGEILFPVLVDYPEEKFGGFFAVTDYRDPVIQDEIKANGWMIWPPIRYSYRTVNNDIPEAAPAKPSWLYDEGRALQPLSAGRRRPELHARQLELAGHRRPGARRAGARHLRLPHLGAVRPDPDHRARRSSASRPARCRAISAAGPTSSSSASSRSGRRSRCSICC